MTDAQDTQWPSKMREELLKALDVESDEEYVDNKAKFILEDILPIFLAHEAEAVAAIFEKIPINERYERYDYNIMKAQRTENHDYHTQHLMDAPVGSPERLVAYISNLSPWNLRNAVDYLRQWREEAVIAARIEELEDASRAFTHERDPQEWAEDRIKRLQREQEGK